jgi:hypothetical protein
VGGGKRRSGRIYDPGRWARLNNGSPGHIPGDGWEAARAQKSRLKAVGDPNLGKVQVLKRFSRSGFRFTHDRARDKIRLENTVDLWPPSCCLHLL